MSRLPDHVRDWTGRAARSCRTLSMKTFRPRHMVDRAFELFEPLSKPP
jgi:hypothetical protein